MAATIAHFAARVEALATRLPSCSTTPSARASKLRLRTTSTQGVPRELAERVVTFDTLYATLDIVEVADSTRRPVETVAEIYFDLATRLGLPWLRETIVALPGDAHWQMLAKGAMHDDLSGLQRTITAEVIAGGGDIAAPAGLIAAWQDRNGRGIERAKQLLGELRNAAPIDASMLSVALRELRNLG